MRPSGGGGWTLGAALARVVVQHEHTRATIGPASRVWCSGGAVSSGSTRCHEDDGDWLGWWAAGLHEVTGPMLRARKGSEGMGHLGCGKKKKWVGWGIWPKRVLGLKNPLYFLVFESNFLILCTQKYIIKCRRHEMQQGNIYKA
jgi:hypothetical protein